MRRVSATLESPAAWGNVQGVPDAGRRTADRARVRYHLETHALQLQAGGEGGMTFYELTVVRPSFQFLGDQYQLVRDLPIARLSPGHSALGSFEITGNVVMTGLTDPRFVLVYIHPSSPDGFIDVQTGARSIPVPFSPYGQVRLKFR